MRHGIYSILQYLRFVKVQGGAFFAWHLSSFLKRDWELWDKKIENDSRQGKLDFLIKEALQEKEKGGLRQL